MAATRTSPRKSAARDLSTASPTVKPEPSEPELPPLADTPTKRKRGGAPVKADPSEIEDLLKSTSSTVKKEEEHLDGSQPASPSKKSTSERKLASYKASIIGSPFPDHALPTGEEAERVAWILGDFHGYKRESEGGRGLPKYTTPKGESKWGGCGDVPSVLDAVVRTVLSCNTSNRNSAAAHRSMTEHFGVQNWERIHNAPESELVEAIRCGGLANNKARTIKGILSQTLDHHGKLSLDHLHNSTDDEIMQELVSFNGVGPKIKTETNGEVDYTAALEAARKASASDLLRMVQKSRSTRSKNPISSRLKSSNFSLELSHASTLSSEQRKRVFSLFESNMKAMYRNSVLGWKPAAKRKELFDTESRFAIIRPPAVEGAEIAAFAMFRFDTEPCHPSKDAVAKEGEEKVEVVYLYEIQVRKENQRDGLGKELMDVVYELGKETRMRKVMLTVFDENKGAKKFYVRQGYEVDPISPSLDEQRKATVDFETMFKVVQH
ncbi:hypothetical protein NDA16_001290 [Ustilago loliicola]|nr:hypothetical protein NDA16_001290 [Ustilago loliicola]